MAVDEWSDDDLLPRVRELRARGDSPKDIARELGARPGVVKAMVRTIARESGSDTATGPAEPGVVGCWVSPGWSSGLSVDDRPDWPQGDASAAGVDGLVAVLVALRHRPHRVSVAGYLVDVYCLGVKNALGPRIVSDLELHRFRREFFSGFGDSAGVEAPMELARHLVCGAVDYARGLGFEPHPDFEPVAEHLDPWPETSAITFGREGVPYYVSGPQDSPQAVVRTLTESVGEGNFQYVVGLDAATR